jgi:hypothetical protein
MRQVQVFTTAQDARTPVVGLILFRGLLIIPIGFQQQL